MFVPGNRSSSERMLDTFGAYLSARRQASPETTGLSAMFEKAQESLAATNERQRKARRGQQNALATRDYVAFLMDRLVTASSDYAARRTARTPIHATARPKFDPVSLPLKVSPPDGEGLVAP